MLNSQKQRPFHSESPKRYKWLIKAKGGDENQDNIEILGFCVADSAAEKQKST